MSSPPTKESSDPWHEEATQFVTEYWELSHSEQDDLRLLRDALQDVDHWKNCPDTVVRFLRARPGDPNAAEKMFRDMVQWRLDNKVDTILEDYTPPTLMQKYTPGAVLKGLDREGDPIFASRLGATDTTGLLEKYGEDELVQYAIWIRELVSRGDWKEEYEKQQGRPVKRVTIIEDLDGFSVLPSSKEISVYGKIMRLDQDNYCETAKKLLIIRAPFLFRAVWAVVKHFFDVGVVDKMVFAGSSDYKDVLSNYIDPEVLPSEIHPELGKGEVAKGMIYNFKGGLVPE